MSDSMFSSEVLVGTTLTKKIHSPLSHFPPSVVHSN